MTMFPPEKSRKRYWFFLYNSIPTSVVDERWIVFCKSPSIAPTNVAGIRPISFVRKFLTWKSEFDFI
jgi:hypothetical protein